MRENCFFMVEVIFHRFSLHLAHRLASVDIEATVFPGVEDRHPFRREELLLDQEVDDLGAEEFFQGLEFEKLKG